MTWLCSFLSGDSLLALIASQNKSKDVEATPRGRDALLLSASSNNFSSGSSGPKGLERYSRLSYSCSHLPIASRCRQEFSMLHVRLWIDVSHRNASLLARTAALKLAESKPLPPLPMAKLVDCLVKLGGIVEAQLTLRRHMPTQVLCLRVVNPKPLCPSTEP